MILTLRHKSASRRAVAAVEAAVALPILLIFLAGVVDLGRLGKIADSVSNAARNGAQYGSVNTTALNNAAGIRAAAVTEMAGLPNVETRTQSDSRPPRPHAGVIPVTVTYTMSNSDTILFRLRP